MKTLLGVVGDLDVRAKDTEVGEGTPLTSPFIEGIYGEISELETRTTTPRPRSLDCAPLRALPSG